MKTNKLAVGLLCLGLAPAMHSLGQSQAPQTTRPAVPAKPLKIAPGQGAPKAATTRPQPLAAGTVAPDFASQDLQGKQVKLSDYKDKIVVLDFWATWCGPCKASLPHTQEIAKQAKDQGVTVLAVCTSDTRAKFEEFVKANQEKYPDIVFTSDPNERGSATYAERASTKHYQVSGIPTQFVIGKDGKVAAALVGFSEGDHRLADALAGLGVKLEKK